MTRHIYIQTGLDFLCVGFLCGDEVFLRCDLQLEVGAQLVVLVDSFLQLHPQVLYGVKLRLKCLCVQSVHNMR